MRFQLCRPAAVLLAVLVAAGLAGCGSKTDKTNVTGKVTYNGNPLDKPNGTIVFVGPDGSQATANISADGSYTAEGASQGENKVAVYYPSTPNQPGGGRKARVPPPGGWGNAAPAAPASPFLTPSEYASVDTSKLTVTVAKDTVYNVDMTGPPIK